MSESQKDLMRTSARNVFPQSQKLVFAKKSVPGERFLLKKCVFHALEVYFVFLMICLSIFELFLHNFYFCGLLTCFIDMCLYLFISVVHKSLFEVFESDDSFEIGTQVDRVVGKLCSPLEDEKEKGDTAGNDQVCNHL